MTSAAVPVLVTQLRKRVVPKWKITLTLVLLVGTFASGRGILAQTQSPKATEPPRTDREGDPLPAGAFARVGTVRAPIGRVFSVAISPDGTKLASAGWDDSIRVWKLGTAKEPQLHAGHAGWIRSVAFSSDGLMLASGGKDHVIRLWDSASGKEIRRLTGHQAEITFVAFSPDRKILASKGKDHTLRIWDVATGRELRQLGERNAKRYFSEPDCPFAFSPDGKTLVSPSGYEGPSPAERRRTLRMWDVANGEELRHFVGQRPSFGALALSPDGLTLASGSLNEPLIRLWTTTGKELPSLRIPATEVTSLVFSPDGKSLAWRGGDDVLHVWEMATRREYSRFEGDEPGRSGIAFSPDGRVLASGSTDVTVLLWDLTGLAPTGGLPPIRLGSEELQRLWAELESGDPRKGRRALWMLVAGSGQAVPFLAGHLRAAATADPIRLEQWLRDLDSQEFTTREAAVRELEKFGEVVEPSLHQVLRGKPSLEVRRRVEGLLARLEEWPPERLRDLRAVEALEHIGAPDAQQVLRTLADGAPTARLTREAKASLQRIAKHR
jgi:WD40 repeat protein